MKKEKLSGFAAGMACMLAMVPALALAASAVEDEPSFHCAGQASWLSLLPLLFILLVLGVVVCLIFRSKGWKGAGPIVISFVPGLNYFALIFALGAPDLAVRRRLEEIARKVGLAADNTTVPSFGKSRDEHEGAVHK